MADSFADGPLNDQCLKKRGIHPPLRTTSCGNRSTWSKKLQLFISIAIDVENKICPKENQHKQRTPSWGLPASFGAWQPLFGQCLLEAPDPMQSTGSAVKHGTMIVRLQLLHPPPVALRKIVATLRNFQLKKRSAMTLNPATLPAVLNDIKGWQVSIGPDSAIDQDNHQPQNRLQQKRDESRTYGASLELCLKTS